MKANQLIMLSLATAMGVTSCSPVLYTTSGQNVPLFREKGEVAFNVGYFGIPDVVSDVPYFYDTDIKGYAGQFAAAIDSSVAVMSSFYTLKASDEWEVKGTYFDAGVGIFNHGKEFTGEIFAGIGVGSMKNSYDFEKIDAKYLKFFIQPSGGFTSKVIDMAFTPRIGWVTYTKHSSNVTDPLVEDFFSQKKTTFVFEPGVTIRMGYKNVKFQYQYNYSTFSYEGTDEFDPVGNRFSSFSLYVLITDRWNDK
jgi:hypothetical protein